MNPDNISQILGQLDSKIIESYKQIVENYRSCVIPFESKRIKENLSLTSKNTSLERDKRELQRRIQKITSQNQRQQYVMQRQAQKINHLEHTVSDMDKVSTQNLNMIEALRFTAAELETELSKQNEILKNTEEEKKKVLKQHEDKNNQYNSLLSNYMKDKNQIAEKLNYMNELEQNIFNKEKKLKQQEIYLKKQWDEFENEKRLRSRKPPKIFRKPTDEKVPAKQAKVQKPKYEKDEILKNPIKKIVKHHSNQIYDACLNYSGNLLATCGGDRFIKIYDMVNFQLMSNIQTHAESIPLCLALDYSGEKILVGSTDKSVLLFSTSTGKQVHSFVGHGYKINSVSWTSEKQKCVSGSQDKQIKVWDVEKVTNLFSIQCGKAVKSLNCNTTQPIIYSGHSDGSVRLYSLTQSASPISQIKGIIDYPINSVLVLSNRTQLLVSSQQGSPIHILDLKMNKSVAKFEGKDFFNTVAKAEMSPSEKYVVAGNCDGVIYYWNREKATLEKKVSGHDTSVTALRYHPITNYLVSCDKTGNIIIWQPNS